MKVWMKSSSLAGYNLAHYNNKCLWTMIRITYYGNFQIIIN